MRHFDRTNLERCRWAWLLALPLFCGAAWAVEPLPMTEVAPGVFVYQAPYVLAAPANGGAVGNLGFVVGETAVAVIDTGGSREAGERLLAAVRARTSLPVRHVISTHFHPDHVLGNAAFRSPETRFHGHKNLKLALATRASVYLEANRRLVGDAAFAGTEIVPPDDEVETTATIDLGGRILELEAQPTAHTNADLTVFDRRTGTWWLADLLFQRHLPAVDGSLNGWLGWIARAKARPAARVIPGHGPASLPWPEAIGPQERYLDRLRADLRRMIAAGRPIAAAAAEAGLSERAAWDLFEDFNGRNATAGFKELEWE